MRAGDGQLVAKLGNVGGEGCWGLGLVRLVEKGGIPEIQAVCVVSKTRARRGKVEKYILWMNSR